MSKNKCTKYRKHSLHIDIPLISRQHHHPAFTLLMRNELPPSDSLLCKSFHLTQRLAQSQSICSEFLYRKVKHLFVICGTRY